MRRRTEAVLSVAAVVLVLAGCGDDNGGGGTAPPTITWHPSNQTVTEGEAATFAVTATGSGVLSYQWKKGGVDATAGTGGTTASYTAPATVLADNGAQYACVVTNAGGSVTSKLATLTVNMAPPTITTHPADQTVTEGQTVTFSVIATGSGTLAYQWYKGGVAIAGAQLSYYTTPPTMLADDGALFACMVTNTAGSVTSDPATLTVNMAPPQITAHPSDQNVTEGQTAAFTVTAAGPGVLSYQWKKDGVDVAAGTGGTTASYTTPATVLADNGAQFTCVVTNAGGSVESNPATLTVDMLPPTITAHPSDQTVTEGQTATFSVTATGSGTLTYQWKKDGFDVTGGTGGTTDSYTTPATVLADNGAQFTCVVTNAGGSVESNPATLTVDMLPPTITAHPSDQTVTEGQTATFSVTATGSGTLTYQWKKDGFDVTGGTGGTTDSYTTPATVLADNGAQFTCVVTNAGGSVESNAARLWLQVDASKTYMTVDLATGAVTYSETISDLETNDVYKTTKLVLKAIPAGSFQMGDQTGAGDPEELPVHTVNITQAFYMGVFEVTQRQWYEVELNWPSQFVSSPTSLNEKRPVERVSWDDINLASGFMDTLSSLASMSFRLPTEAEWEYCCKAGTSTNYSYGNTEDGAWMWYAVNSGSQTHEVGTTTNKPNPWGLYDMHGSVFEWCEDWYGSGYYGVSPSDDPQGPGSGSFRIFRGGSWGHNGANCRSALRYRGLPTFRFNTIGVRVAAAVAGP